MQYPADIGPRLVRTRRDLGVTQIELGERLGVSQPQIARWEAGSYRSASLERVCAIARALGVGLSVASVPMTGEGRTAYRTPDCELTATASPTEIILDRLGVDRASITTFCKRWGIMEFAVFGSVLRADFGSTSDIDVLVKFDPERRQNFADLDDMTEELVTLFGRSVDLADRVAVEQSANYIRRRAILGDSHTLYAS